MKEVIRFEDETAGKLILAGMELFGEHGFKGTTTRMIADAANANIGSIAYYFGNKQGLYLAIARYIAQRMRETFQLDNSELARDQVGQLDRAEAQRVLERLIRRMVRLFVREEEARRWLMLVIREQANPTEAFDILYEQVFEVAHIIITTLVATLMGRDPAEERVVLETHTLIGQIVFFLVGRVPLLRRLGSGDVLSSKTAAMAEEVVVSHLNALR